MQNQIISNQICLGDIVKYRPGIATSFNKDGGNRREDQLFEVISTPETDNQGITRLTISGPDFYAQTTTQYLQLA